MGEAKFCTLTATCRKIWSETLNQWKIHLQGLRIAKGNKLQPAAHGRILDL
jgi:hypothetical protein